MLKRSIVFDVFKLLALFGVIWAFFTYVPIFSSGKDTFTVSIDTEEKVGDAMAKAVMQSNTLVKDPTLDSAMAVITKRLVKEIGPTDYNYHFRVIESPQINAFTLPGGNIFVYSGLIKLTKNPEELASVLSHEIGHAEKRHVIDRLVKEFGIAVIFSVLTGNNGSVLNKISRTATSRAFDRKQESEADDYAFHLMDRSGIDPQAFATLFQRLDSEQGTNALDFEILRTHPDNNSRIKAAQEYKTAKDFKRQPFNLDWNRIKESMDSKADTL